ncbi:MAG: efflux transporter outer membrane subunit [Planctomycetota bacterium]
MNSRARRLPPVLLPLAVCACTVGPDYAPPPAELPAAFVAPHEDGTVGVDGAFWRSFRDPVLDELVEKALAGSIDLRVAVARLRAARARAGLATAMTRPEIGTHASYSNSRFSDNGFIKGLGGGTPGAVFPGQQIDLHEVGLDASWEIDLFGGGRRSVESATAEADAALADLHGVRVSVLGELCVAYCGLRGFQTRLDVARGLVAAQQESVDVITERAGAGIADPLDLARAQARLATLRARLPELEGAIRTAIRGIETLLGEAPGALDARLTAPGPLPTLPDPLAVGIPSEVLARRPDVRAAERRLAAATARIGVARADLLPRFSLTGSFGLQSQRLDELPQHDSVFWLLGPALRWPLLDFGRVNARIAEADARTEEELARYQGTVLQALSEVEVALVALARDRRQLEELRRAESAAATAVELADERHREGVLEYLDVLDARRTRDDAREAVAENQEAVAVDVVRLIKALGGGWQVPAPRP